MTETDRVRRVVAALHAGRGQPSLVPLVRQVDMSHRRLQQIFLDRTGVTMKQFWLLGRLHLAAEWLASHERRCTVKQAQLEAGFLDPSGFSHLFKHHFGSTPSEFRVAALHRSTETIKRELDLECPFSRCQWVSLCKEWLDPPQVALPQVPGTSVT